MQKFCILIAVIALVFGCTKGGLATGDAEKTVPDAAQTTVDEGADFLAACDPWDDWDKTAPPFRIYGETYYVGTCGISAILIAGNEGHILIDGGPNNGGPLLAANIEALGFDIEDVEILLHTHEHYDHVGGLADLQARSGARVIASALAAPVLASGETAMDDPQFGTHDPFAPVKVSDTISDGETVALGTLKLTAMETPGHTPGALSWSWRDCADGDCKTIVYMDSLSPISRDDYRFSDHADYVAKFRAALVRLQTIPCDVALTPHPAASAMFERLASNVGLIDDAECRLYATDILALLDKRLEKEAR
jgi:metallo-beta-lactamase class B